MDTEKLFSIATTQNTPKTKADKIVENAESEFLGYSEAEKDRQREIKELNEKLKDLTREKAALKNIKNPRLAELNKSRSVKRKTIKAKIEKIKDRLSEIEEERQGANTKFFEN